ncbi:MAG: hypothetical protein K2J57_03975, partial [Bacteroidales bacterium]|nr:hypothetical protein [Bacteroidales bacterium]
LSLTFVPRYSGLTGDPDTVQVYGSREVSVCDDGNEPIFVWSNSIITRRVGKPLFTYITPDTAVEKNAVLNLQASAMVGDGDDASFLWIKGEDEVVGRASVCPQVISESAVFRVWAYQDAVYDLSEKCFSEAMVKVSVIDEGGDTVGPLPLLPSLSLTPSATWLCGEDSVLYTLASVAGYDTLVWFENGLEIARNVWQLRRTPAYTGFDRADTVFVRGIAVDSLTADRDTIRYRTSNIATVHRIEKPVFVKVSPRDTLVADGAEVLLSALATAPDGPQIVYFWIDSLEEEWSEEATFRIYPEKSQHYYVYAEQSRLDNFECYAEDSVWVRVKTDTVAPIKMGEMEVYIPNTVIPYSQKKENKILRVYGLNIKSVHLQVFNDRSEKVYEGEGDSENTYWEVTGA